MNLPGHSHFATVRFIFETTGAVGFPSFADTHAAIQKRLSDMTLRPFRDCTNEKVLEIIWTAFEGWSNPAAEKYKRGGSGYELHAVELAVRGVPDKIGHADGFTVYRKERR